MRSAFFRVMGCSGVLAIVLLLVPSAMAQHVVDDDDDSPEYKAALAKAAKAADTPLFKQALKLVSAATGQPGEPDEEHKGVVNFTAPEKEAEPLLAKVGPKLAPLKCLLVRCDMNHGIDNQPDTLALVGVDTPWAAMWLFGTNAANYDKGTAEVVKWMQQFARENDVSFDTIGFDLCAGRFNKPPKDYLALAKQMYEFCPDIVDQGAGDVEKLAAELKKSGRFFFWWD